MWETSFEEVLNQQHISKYKDILQVGCFFTFKIPVSRCKLVFLEPGHSCSGPCFQSWAWVSVWEGFSLRKWSCPFVSLPYLLHLVVWFIHDLQLTPWPTSSLHIRFRTCSNPITTLMYNYCNLVHPFLTNPHEPPVPQDVICKTKWNIWNKITLRLCSSLGFSHHHVFPHLPPPEIPSGNQTWQWKIPYKWRLKAGNTTTKKTWGFLKTNCKWRFFSIAAVDSRRVSFQGLEIEALYDGVDFSETLTRARFEELNADLFKNTLGPVKQVGFFRSFCGSKNSRFWPTTKKSFGHVWWILMLDGPVV